MRALVFVRPSTVELQDLPRPEAAPGETVVQVRASGICGSELHGFRSVGMRRPPLVMGHEFTGTTSDGRRVVVNPLLACGRCARCRAGAPQQCDERGLVGVSRAGGFADYVAVPDSTLVPLPDGLGFVAGSLIEPLANAVHVAGLLPGDAGRVAVIGGGTIGLLCALYARHVGREVQVVERAAQRQEVLRRLGLPVSDELAGGYDAVVDAVGAGTTRRLSLESVRPGGVVVWVGLAEPEVALDGNAVVRGERRIVGSFAYSAEEFVHAADVAGELDLSWCTEVPLAAAAETFHAMADGDLSMVKAVLVPDHGGAL